MTEDNQDLAALLRRNRELEQALAEAQETLQAIRHGEVDAVIVGTEHGDQVFTLEGADYGYRIMLEQMSEGAVTLNENGAIVFSNLSFAAMIGASLEKVLSSSFSDFVAPESLDDFEELRSSGAGRREINLLGQGKKRVPAFIALNQINLNGVTSLSIVVTDLTEQKRNERIIAEARIVNRIMAQSAEGIIICDARGEIIHASRAAQRLAGGRTLRRKFDEALPVLQIAGRRITLADLEAGAIPNNTEVSAILEGLENSFLLSYGKLAVETKSSATLLR